MGGFCRDDLGLAFDEDPAPDDDEEEEEASGVKQTGNVPYQRARDIASKILLWTRHHLQSRSANTRHLSFVATIDAMTVISTRIRELLPHIHGMWPSVVPAFDSDAPLATQANACKLLKHTARLSGDFVRNRFLGECWPGIRWQLFRARPV